MKEIVIAAYDKNLDWISELNNDIKVTIYRKGDLIDLRENEIKIEPNLGRCVHSFFNHIYLNYDNLSDYTFFVQDFPFDHWGNLIEVLNENTFKNKWELLIGNLNDAYYGFHNNTLGTAWNMYPSQIGVGNIISCKSNGYPQDTSPYINVDKYWNILFSDTCPEDYQFIPGGHFGVSRNHARLRSREFYKKIVDILIDDIYSPWMIERLECYIFNPKFKSIL
jgi:Protein of unknown function (DUF3431)